VTYFYSFQTATGLEEVLDIDFQFHDKYLRSAEKTLKKIVEKHMEKFKRKKKKKKTKFTFVGIHSRFFQILHFSKSPSKVIFKFFIIRRTDHLSLDGVHGIKPLKPSYFLEAMDIYRWQGRLMVEQSDQISSLRAIFHELS